MNRKRIRKRKRIAMLAAAALVGPGLTIGTVNAESQNQSQNLDRTTQQVNHQSKSDAKQHLHFMAYSDTIGTAVVDTNHKDIGSIYDAIVERGSGDIRYLVVDHGGFLGIASKQVAVPYPAFRMTRAKDGTPQLQLNITKQQIKSAHDFDADSFASLKSENWQESVGAYFRDIGDGWDSDNDQQYRQAVRNGQSEKVVGKIVAIERPRDNMGTRNVVLVVQRAGSNQNQRVVVGPVWYVMHQDHTPEADQHVTINMHRFDQDHAEYVATTVKYDKQTMTLRDTKTGEPRWHSDKADKNNKQNLNQYRYIMASDLQGTTVKSGTDELGKISQLVTEAASGQIAFVTIDPDGKLFDKHHARLVPWEKLHLDADNNVKINMAKPAFMNQVNVPASLEQLKNQDYRETMYKRWNTSAPSFEPVRHENSDAS